ncbi:fimbrial protein [Salmonella enterica subsp. enterica serovar Berlin]|nr:fimbrial protein [Salmonella enterica]EBY0806369.1 fimbrial protein [Salmonella enterica subsp. enterica serovar Berlin]
MKSSSVLVLLVYFGVCAIASAFARDNQFATIDGGIVRMRGAIIAATCSIFTDNDKQIIEMGKLRTNQFGGYGSYTPAVPFSIKLADCQPTNKGKIAITFSGIADGKDPLVLRAGTGINAARGVGVAIFDNKDNIVPPNSISQPISDMQGNDIVLQFTARYRATSGYVTGGNADAWTWLTVSYQ